MKSYVLYGVTIRMKPIQQYFYTVLFDLYVVLSCESVHEILWCDYSNETSPAVYFHMVLFISMWL